MADESTVESTEQATTSVESPTTQATEPAQQGEAQTTATPVQTPAKESLDDVLKAAYEKSKPQIDTEEEKAADSDVLKKNTTEEEKEEESAEDKPDEAKPAEIKTDNKGPVPLERFQEVNDKAVRFERELADEKPWADAQRSVVKHCSDNNITSDQFKYWMDVAALASSNPAKALETLGPTLDYLKSNSGDKLPDDLQKMVDNAEIPKPIAERIAKAEAAQRWQGKAQERTAEQQKQQVVQAETQKYVSEMKSALEGWIGSKKSDVDFMPKKNGEPDGKFEFVMQKLRLDLDDASKSKTLQSKEDLIKLAEQAHKDVTTSLSRYLPKPKVNGNRISSTKSNGSVKISPATLEEAVAERLKTKHGIAWTPSAKRK